MTYADLTAELDALLHELEHTPDLPLDTLTQRVQRAYALIGEGRQHLRATEAAVTQVMDTFGEEQPLDDEDDDEEDASPAAETLDAADDE